MIINPILFSEGGGEEPFGLLFVDYPAAASLVVTNTHQYFDQITETKRLYYVSRPSGSTQTCTATISQAGYEARSVSVTFDELAQTKSTALGFYLILYDNGTWGEYGTSLTMYGKKFDNEVPSAKTPSVTYNADNFYLKISSGTGGGYFPVPVNLSAYSTLHIDSNITRGSYSQLYVSTDVLSANKVADNVTAYMVPSSGRGEYTLDISQATAGGTPEQYVGVHIRGTSSVTNEANIYKVWLT